jgi:hypothetical protein
MIQSSFAKATEDKCCCDAVGFGLLKYFVISMMVTLCLVDMV